MKVHSFSLSLVIVLASSLPFVQVSISEPNKESATQEPGQGDWSRGQAIFEGKGQCLDCHRVANHGSRLGPDLSDTGAVMTPVQLQHFLLAPDPEVEPKYRLFIVITRDGVTFTGKLLNQDQFSLQMLDSQERLIAFDKSDLRAYHFAKTRPMPSYRNKLDAQELADLVAFLVSLKGVNQQ
jgi:putative heme-binding domain-containing protein